MFEDCVFRTILKSCSNCVLIFFPSRSYENHNCKWDDVIHCPNITSGPKNYNIWKFSQKKYMTLELEVTLTCSESIDKQNPELCFVSVHFFSPKDLSQHELVYNLFKGFVVSLLGMLYCSVTAYKRFSDSFISVAFMYMCIDWCFVSVEQSFLIWFWIHSIYIQQQVINCGIPCALLSLNVFNDSEILNMYVKLS